MKTKNSFTAFLIILFLSFVTQIGLSQNQSIGIALGTNVTNITGGSSSSETQNRLGIAAGIFMK